MRHIRSRNLVDTWVSLRQRENIVRSLPKADDRLHWRSATVEAIGAARKRGIIQLFGVRLKLRLLGYVLI